MTTDFGFGAALSLVAMGHRTTRATGTAVGVELVSPSALEVHSVEKDALKSQEKTLSRKTRSSSTKETRGRDNSTNGLIRGSENLPTPRQGMDMANSCKFHETRGKENVAPSSSRLQDERVSQSLTTSAGSKKLKKRSAVTRSTGRKRLRADAGIGVSKVQATLAGEPGAPPSEVNVDDENNQSAERNGAFPTCTKSADQEAAVPVPELDSHEMQVPASENQNPAHEDCRQTRESNVNEDEALAETSALMELQKSYDKIYKKYQKLKARKDDEAEALYEDQRLRISAYVKAAEALVDHLKKENTTLKMKIQESGIPEILNRSRLLEKVNAEYRNDLVMEQAKNLELRHKVKRLESLLLQQGSCMKDICSKSNDSYQQMNHDSQFPDKANQHCCTISHRPMQLAFPKTAAESCMLNIRAGPHFPVDMTFSDPNICHLEEARLTKDVDCSPIDERMPAAKVASAANPPDSMARLVACNGATDDFPKPQTSVGLNEDGISSGNDSKRIYFRLHGEPGIQIVLDGVQKFSNGLMDYVPFMLMHPSVSITCMCTVSAFASEDNARAEREFNKAKEDKWPDSDPNVTLVDVTKRDEALVDIRNQLKLLVQLLEHVLGLKLTVTNDGSHVQLEFVHRATGFSFKLRSISDKDIEKLVGGGELLYQLVSLGTLCRKAVDWMKEEEAVFGMAQAQLFFKRLLQVAQFSGLHSFLEA